MTLHEKSVGSPKSEYLAARDNERKAEDEARKSLIKARKADSIGTRSQNSTTDRNSTKVKEWIARKPRLLSSLLPLPKRLLRLRF